MHIEHLVVAFEEELLSLVLEADGYLSPEIGKDILVFVKHRIACPEPALGSGVMVHVEHAVQAFVEHIAYHLFDALHPGFVHIALSIDVLGPGHRNADYAEALLLEHMDELTCGNRLSPGGFPG